MKKLVYLFFMSFVTFAFTSCSSSEQDDWDGHPLSPLFSEEDVEQIVRNGDEFVIKACQDVTMMVVATNGFAMMDSDMADPQVARWIFKEDPAPKELTFHWLNIKQEAPDKFVFAVQCEKEDEPKEIYLRFCPIGFDSNWYIHFTLE